MSRKSNVFLPGLLTANECDQVISAAMSLPSVNGDMGQNKDFPEIRSSTLRWVYSNNPQFHAVFERILPVIANANAESFGFDIEPIDSLQFTEYHGGRLGKYADHIDLFMVSDSDKDRKLSFVIQLSDPLTYHGGDLHIHCDNHPNPMDLRQRGGFVIFPSFLQHGVHPVTYGLRHSLVGWIMGPKLR